MVTPLLHLHKRTGAAGKIGDQMGCGLPCRHNVGHSQRLGQSGGGPALGLQLFLIPQNTGHTGQGRPVFGVDLGGAAGHHNAGIGVFAVCAADGLPRLPLRLARNRTGVDDNYIAKALRVVTHDLALPRIQAAAEGQDFWPGGHDG